MTAKKNTEHGCWRDYCLLDAQTLMMKLYLLSRGQRIFFLPHPWGESRGESDARRPRLISHERLWLCLQQTCVALPPPTLQCPVAPAALAGEAGGGRQLTPVPRLRQNGPGQSQRGTGLLRAVAKAAATSGAGDGVARCMIPDARDGKVTGSLSELGSSDVPREVPLQPRPRQSRVAPWSR